jgi:hypothetical protein
MEEGFLQDATHGGSVQGSWIEGSAKKSFWTGVKTTGRRRIPMDAWRCPSCALVLFYAPDEE